jgi:cephalosporin-C deacetylase
MIFDLELDELLTYRPDREEPADFDEFWATTLDEAAAYPLDATFTPVATGLATVDTFDVTFHGYGGQPVKGWLNVPRQRSGPLPCVVEYLGYGGGRGLPTEWLLYSAAGYAHLVMDTRGQGGSWASGDTPDIAESAPPHHPGFLTLGIGSPQTYYYRRLYVDAVRAVAAARASALVDEQRVAVSGSSQGGGVAIAVSGLVEGLRAVLPGVPFLCHFSRAIRVTDALPYAEVARYLRANPRQRDAALRTLTYFDGVNFAARAGAPSLFSVALMDDVCPPSTVAAAYHHYAGDKEIRVWEFNEHDGAGPHHDVERLAFLAARM